MKTILVTGAAGFIGSYLVDRLLNDGNNVVGVDNLLTGRRDNLADALKKPQFRFIEADATVAPSVYLPNDTQFDLMYHLASPASPIWYQRFPIETYLVNSLGTHELLKFAQQHQVRVVFTSTSEVYGDPLEHPQKETYFGNVNPVGPRACYDESKRFGEMACRTFYEQYRLDVRTVRIFNTYGPRMDPKDGRIMPTLISQALDKKALTIEGDGTQTRSFCYVDDMVEFLVRAGWQEQLAGEIINIGNPDERTVMEVAETIRQITHSPSEITHLEGRPEDITRRCPDIAKAQKLLGYTPKVSLTDGLAKTIEAFNT